MREKWDQKTLIMDNMFFSLMVIDVIRNDEDPKPKTMDEYQHRNYWPK